MRAMWIWSFFFLALLWSFSARKMEAAEQRRQDHQFKADVKLIFMTSWRPEPQEILENTARCKKLAVNTWRLFLRRPWLEGMSPIAISLENEPKKLKTLLCFMCQSLLTGWIGRDEKGREAPGRRFKIISTLPLDNSVFFHKFSQFWFVLILVPLWPQLLVDFDFGLFCCLYIVEDMRLWCIAWVTVSSEAFWTVWFLLIRWCCVTLVSLRAAVSSAVKCISKIVRGKVFTPSL